MNVGRFFILLIACSFVFGVGIIAGALWVLGLAPPMPALALLGTAYGAAVLGFLAWIWQLDR